MRVNLIQIVWETLTYLIKETIGKVKWILRKDPTLLKLSNLSPTVKGRGFFYYLTWVYSICYNSLIRYKLV